VVDEASGEVWVDRCPVHLSQKQRALFMLLWHRRGHACTKDEIARVVWPECKGEIYDYQIESLVKRLRAKLEPHPEEPVMLLTVAGCGYRLAI
jgi:DNA-binding response OmpR family regulator